MARIIIADSSGHQLNVDQATYDNGFYPGWTYVGPADGGTPIAYDTYVDNAVTQVVNASGSKLTGALKAAYGRPARWASLPKGWDTGWQAAKAAQASTPVNIAVLGTSISSGQGSSEWITKGWPGQLKADLVSAGNIWGGDFFPVTTYSSLTTANAASRLYAITGGSYTVYECGYGRLLGPFTVTTLTFTTPYACTSLDIIYVDYASGTWTYSIDGGTSQTVTTTGPGTPAGATLKKITVTGLSAATHTVTMGGSSGANVILINGITTYAATNGLRMARSTYPGIRAVDLATPSGTATAADGTPSFPSDKIQLWQGNAGGSAAQFADFPGQPHLAIVELGVNDNTYGAHPTLYELTLHRLVEAFRRGRDDCSILFLAPSFPDSSRSSDVSIGGSRGWSYPRYKGIARKVADLYGCGFIDIDAKWGTTAYAAGYQPNNDLHPLDAGHADIASVVAAVL